MKAMLLIVGPAVFGSILIVGIASNGVDEVKVLGGQSGKHVSPGYRSDWTHKELIAHFRASGMDVDSMPSGLMSIYLGPKKDIGSCKFWSAHGKDVVEVRNAIPDDIIEVDLMRTETLAREAAGTLGDNGFAWHRFLFHGRVDLLARYRAAL
jgi:hypothetical protein